MIEHGFWLLFTAFGPLTEAQAHFWDEIYTPESDGCFGRYWQGELARPS